MQKKPASHIITEEWASCYNCDKVHSYYCLVGVCCSKGMWNFNIRLSVNCVHDTDCVCCMTGWCSVTTAVTLTSWVAECDHSWPVPVLGSFSRSLLSSRLCDVSGLWTPAAVRDTHISLERRYNVQHAGSHVVSRCHDLITFRMKDCSCYRWAGPKSPGINIFGAVI